MQKRRHLSLPERQTYRCVEDVVGCKWSAAVVAAVSEGIRRPGELERFIPGISTKVLNERLRKLVDFGLLTRTVFDQKPPRVDYALTPAGRKLARILLRLRDFNRELAGGQTR